jgi:hypothetical protein
MPMQAAAAVELRERYHPRVEANFMVKVLVNGRAVLAKARDLSMAGLAVAWPYAHANERITVSVPLPGDREVVTTCSIRRRKGDMLALEYDDLDWDDMLALARFLHPRLP